MQNKKPKLYWIVRAGERIGPVSSKTIRDMAASDALFASDVLLGEDEQTGHFAVKYFPNLKKNTAVACQATVQPPPVQKQAVPRITTPTWWVHVPADIQQFIRSLGSQNPTVLVASSLTILFCVVGATSLMTWRMVRSAKQVTHDLSPFAMFQGLALPNSDTPEVAFARMKKSEENSKRLAELREADQKKRAEEMVRVGVALMDSGKTRAAIDKFQTATQIAPKSGEAFLCLARAYVQEKSASKAIAAYCNAERVALEPTQREQILCELANEYSHADNHSQRLKIIEQLCSEFRQTIDYRLERAFAARLAREVSKSNEYFESLIADDRDQLTMEQASSVLLEIARIHVAKDRTPESLVACNRLLANDPKSAPGRFLRMMIYSENQRPMDALNDYQELRMLDSKEPWMVERFAESLERNAQHGTMLAPLDDLIANDKSDQIGRWYLLRSTAHAHLGNIDFAKHDGERAQSNLQFHDSNFCDAVSQLNRDVKRMQKDGISYGEILAIRKRPIQFNVESSIVGRGSRNSSPAPRQTEGLYDWLSPGQAMTLGAYGLMPNHGLTPIPR